MTRKLMIAQLVDPQPTYEGHGVYIVPQFLDAADPFAGAFIDIESMKLEMCDNLTPPFEYDAIVERLGCVWRVTDYDIEPPNDEEGPWYWRTTLEAVLDENGKQMTNKNPFFAGFEVA